MPTEAELRALPETPDVEFQADDAVDCEQFEGASTKRGCFWSERGRQAGTNINRVGGVYLGRSAIGSSIWASLTTGAGTQCLCDAPSRAFLRLQSVNDRRTAPDVRAVLVTGLLSLAEVREWDSGIQGNSLADRYAFAYDVLVAEAKGDTDS